MIKVYRRASIVLKPIEINIDNNELFVKTETDNYNRTTKKLKSDSDLKEPVDDLSKTPLIYFNNILIDGTKIKRLFLYNTEFLPRIEIEFEDPSTNILKDNYPLDNSIVSFYIDSKNDAFYSIRMDFKVISFDTIKKYNYKENVYFRIVGILNVDDFYKTEYESYIGTSYSVINEITKNIGLGFASNIENSNDQQVWINNAMYKIDFIKKIIEHSYISDKTFVFGFVDFYYNFNYIDIEKQLSEDISNQMTVIDSKLIKNDDKSSIVNLKLSNSPDFNNTEFKINKYTIENDSTSTNLNYGYRHKVIYFDSYENKIKKYLIDAITNDSENNIVLKDNSEEGDKLYNNMIKTSYLGKCSVNVHANYIHSKIHNSMNLDFLQKLKMTVELNKVNYALYRFQKINVELYDLSSIEKEKDLKRDVNEKNIYKTKLIERLSGEWLITGIKYIYDIERGENIQELTLVKRELTLNYKNK